MLPRSQSDNFANGRPKKKPPPPRPPQPSHLKLQSSTSYRSTQNPSDPKSCQRSMSVSLPGSQSVAGSDLIDFSTPPVTPPQSNSYISSVANKPSEFMYRVGASIFYIKSPLKNSTSEKPTVHPFSPPRPSPQSLLSTPVKSANSTQPTNNIPHSSLKPTPTIIRPHGVSNSSNSSTSTSSSNNNTWNVNPAKPLEPTHYGNIPLTWDEPPKKAPPIAPKPTIIKPPPTTSITSTPAASTATYSAPTTRNYYDEPPEEDEFDAGDSFVSPPMPHEPPPPPPPDLELDPWEEGVIPHAEEYGQYADTYTSTTEGDSAYALVLYDFTPEQAGDLALQAGDLVYLIKKIDDSWLYGTCGGAGGMFPSNYVNIQVPLPLEEEVPQSAQSAEVTSVTSTSPTPETPDVDEGNAAKIHYANVLYQFKAETDNDLNLEPGNVVAIWGRINDDWLYGSVNRQYGQFPASFVDTVPEGLPIIEV